MVNLKTVLVVDDNALNRSTLKKILSKSYNIMEVENCSQAMETLKERTDEIAIVILNIVTPIKDGYIFLETVHRDTRYSNIPVIVTAEDDGRQNEEKILSLGAWDFISQPYDPSIIKIRVKNAIERSQFALTNQLKYLSAFDTLTGTYNKSKFFSATREMIDNDSE
ncbi:MAG: response regulator, partial [Oscillospiraceae bacterium]